MSPRSSPIDYDRLVEETRVHADCYRDPRVFEDELERIYHRTWVYLGHESEIPEPGDFKQAWIGRQSVLLIRGEDGRARALMNRCSHRAATLCQTERGNARVLRCAYHGWSYDSAGRMVTVNRAFRLQQWLAAEAFIASRWPTHQSMTVAGEMLSGLQVDGIRSHAAGRRVRR